MLLFFCYLVLKKREREMERASVYMIMSTATEDNCHSWWFLLILQNNLYNVCIKLIIYDTTRNFIKEKTGWNIFNIYTYIKQKQKKIINYSFATLLNFLYKLCFILFNHLSLHIYIYIYFIRMCIIISFNHFIT